MNSRHALMVVLVLMDRRASSVHVSFNFMVIMTIKVHSYNHDSNKNYYFYINNDLWRGVEVLLTP